MTTRRKSAKKHARGGKGSIKKYLLFGGLGLAVALLALLAILFILPYPKIGEPLKNLKQVVEFANSLPEDVPPVNIKDFRNPSWKPYQEKRRKSWFTRKLLGALYRLGIKKRPVWEPESFMELMKETKEVLKSVGFKNDVEQAVMICPNPGAKIVVFGDLIGAFHSFVRDLQKLHEMKIIGKDLKLKSPDYYILMDGDLASRSAHIMELLSVVMRLQQQNPGQVFYITGNNERNDAWVNYGLGEELSILLKWMDSKKKPILKQVEKYFMLLPMAVYFSVPPHTTHKVFRVSHFAISIPSIEAYRPFVEKISPYKRYMDVLFRNRAVGKVAIADVDDSNLRAVNIPEIIAQIKSFRKTKEFKKTKGLMRLPPENDVPSWFLISGPSIFALKIAGFKNDSFAVVDVTPDPNTWTITHYWHDKTGSAPDYHEDSYYLISGSPVGAGGNVLGQMPSGLGSPSQAVSTAAPAPTTQQPLPGKQVAQPTQLAQSPQVPAAVPQVQAQQPQQTQQPSGGAANPLLEELQAFGSNTKK